jgi:hypothetical protein
VTRRWIDWSTRWSIVEPWTSRTRAATHSENAKGGPSLLSRPLSRTQAQRAVMFSTALRQRWLALKDGVKIGERWLGYAADECRRITVLQQSASAIVRMTGVLTCGTPHEA